MSGSEAFAALNQLFALQHVKHLQTFMMKDETSFLTASDVLDQTC